MKLALDQFMVRHSRREEGAFRKFPSPARVEKLPADRSFSIPKGLHHIAQGCEARATLGQAGRNISTLKGLQPRREWGDATPSGLEKIREQGSQGSAWGATLGYVMPSRWDFAKEFPNGTSSRRLLRSDWSRRAALTLLEMMVAVTLLAVIMVGLLMMFNQTQKALHIASQQSDVFEATRATVQMISRDLAELSDFNQPNQPRVTNCYSIAVPSPFTGSALPLPPPLNTQPVAFGEAFWLTRANDLWNGVGYFVDGTNSGIGTLYRYSEPQPVRANVVPQLIGRFFFTNSRPVMDGVVHFAMSAVYVTNNGSAKSPVAGFNRNDNFAFPHFVPEVTAETNGGGPAPVITYTTNIISIPLPAFIDLEFGVLEPASLKQFQSLTGSAPAAAQSFLLNHVGQIHFFRERVPVRNFVNPYRSHEAP
jgi:hypothetical protein